MQITVMHNQFVGKNSQKMYSNEHAYCRLSPKINRLSKVSYSSSQTRVEKNG